MRRLGLSESGEKALLEKLEEFREIEMENQRLEAASGKADETEERSNGQLLYIALWLAADSLKEENLKKWKELEVKRNVGSEHIRADGQYKSPDAQQALCIHYEMHE